MKKLFGYILAGLLILPLILMLPACKKADDGSTGLGEKMKQGTVGTADEGAGEDPLAGE
jgi:hypothetical protein